jgi:aquaporin Z
MILMLVVVGTIDLSFGGGRLSLALGSRTWRNLFVGASVATAIGAIAISPLGKRSGAHLNPAVTIGFWLRRMMHSRDAASYISAQMFGAIVGVAAARAALGPRVGIPTVSYGMTLPGPGWSDVGAVAGEAVLTAVLVGSIQLSLCHRRTARLTPIIAGMVLMVLIWQARPYTGAGLNQARGLGPDVIAGRYPSFEVYLFGPTMGAVFAAAGLALITSSRPVAASLCPVAERSEHGS